MGNKSNLGLSIRHLNRVFLLFSIARALAVKVLAQLAEEFVLPLLPRRLHEPRAHLRAVVRASDAEAAGGDQGGATFTANKPVVYSLAPPLRTSGHTARWLVRAFETGLPETDSEYAARAGRPFFAPIQLRLPLRIKHN